MLFRLTAEFSPEAIEELKKPVVGSGGFQSLLRKLQGQLAGRSLSLDRDDLSRLVHYTTDYREGGFQDRLKALSREVNDLIKDLRNALLE